MLLRSMLALAVLAAVGCDNPPVDDFRSEGGASPDPTGVIEGTVLYIGPKPQCQRNEEGRAIRARGAVVLTLFEYDNPPPPTGQATGAENLLTIPGSTLFPNLSDCMPLEPGAGDRVPITRSVDFSWPEINLGAGEPIAYQVRGFYDYDEDFNPFFTVTNLATSGDIGGGAIVDPTAAIPRYTRVQFGCRPTQDDELSCERPNGERFSGVSVTLGAPVITERPVFKLDTDPLSAEALLPTTDDPIAAEAELAGLTNTFLELFPRSPDNPETAALLKAMNVGIRNPDPLNPPLQTQNPLAYAWYVRDIDADGDGETDLHPILGRTQGILWSTPAPILRRAVVDPTRAAVESRARIPDVLLLPSVRPTDGAQFRVRYPRIQVAVPPVAAVQLAPEPQCRVPYIAPGNPAPFYTDPGSTNECHEVPTGLYGVNVLHGVAAAGQVGGQSCSAPEDCSGGSLCTDGVCRAALSQTGLNLAGGAYSSQAWTIPNQFGDPRQVCPPSKPFVCPDTSCAPNEDVCGTEQGTGPDQPEQYAVASQGIAGMFPVVDPQDGPLGRRDGAACAEGNYTDFANFGDQQQATIDLCCRFVQHLCDRAPCALLENGIRDSPTEIVGVELVDGDLDGVPETEVGVPNCTPFYPPAFCCTNDAE